ncbi:MAG TPA: hypothetical protein VHM70_00700 [Polyangiaceae bacterium]|jgi:hypothetical protein|nr:hypothetical protein [Polyangiaceae bacterium]
MNLRLASSASCATLLLTTLLSVSCGDGQVAAFGPSEAFRVRNAQFIEGDFPGTAPRKEPKKGEPTVTALELKNRVVYQGQGGKSLSGRVSTDSRSVGIALEDVGSGYWVIPAGNPDPTTNELTWSVTADFDLRLESGMTNLWVVAIDEDGHAGARLEQQLCIASRVPDNLNSCVPTQAPPQAVISLDWSVNADLDLQVVAPNGKIISPKHPTTNDPDEPGKVADGKIDRDSNAGCVIDGQRHENLIWNADMPRGRYKIYVNLFDSCRQSAVPFDVSVYTQKATKDGAKLVQKLERYGELVEAQVNTENELGSFVAEYRF